MYYFIKIKKTSFLPYPTDKTTSVEGINVHTSTLLPDCFHFNKVIRLVIFHIFLLLR